MTTVIPLKANMDSKFTDIELIGLLLKGDQSKFRELYARHKRSTFLTCLRYAKSKAEAEDYLQDSFVNIYKSLGQYDHSKGKFSTWINRVTINTCLMHLRKKTMQFVNTEIPDNITSDENDTAGIDKLSLQELTKLIQSLPNGYRTVFNMYVVDGYTHKEIGEYLGISESTSKTQLFKAKKQLQTILKTTNKELKYG